MDELLFYYDRNGQSSKEEYLCAVGTRSSTDVTDQPIPLRRLTSTNITEALKFSYERDDYVKQVRENPQYYKQYVWKNDLLYHQSESHGLRLYIPKMALITDSNRRTTIMRSQLLMEYHDSLFAGHAGMNRMAEHLGRYFYWERMRDDIRTHIRGCQQCQQNKYKRGPPIGLYTGRRVPVRRWETISIDFITDLPLTNKGNNAILVVMDMLSKRVYCIECNMTLTGKETAELLVNSVFRHVGLPSRIICDNDVRYTSKIFEEVMKILGIKLSLGPTYAPLWNSANE